jgi:hypothetical protein
MNQPPDPASPPSQPATGGNKHHPLPASRRPTGALMPGTSPRTTTHAVPITRLKRRPLALLQALDDAITYRRERITAPCPGCLPGKPRCDDHACDLDLITSYHHARETENLHLNHTRHPTHDTSPAEAGTP